MKMTQVAPPSGDNTKQLTKEDVWGEYDRETLKEITKGMVVAESGDICPIFGDKVSSKSVTVICNENQLYGNKGVEYWLEYVHGSGCIQKTMEIGSDKVAIRSDYMAW